MIFTALVIAIVVFLVLGAISLAVFIARSESSGPSPHDSPDYRNHLAMARWIERQLNDDMVRVTVPEPAQVEARELLDRFYRERRQLGGGS